MAKTTKTEKPEAPAFTWDDLPESEVAEYSRTPIRVNLEEITPEVVKKRVQEAYDFYTTAETDAARKVAWKVQECGSADRAEEFIRLARRYAGFRDMTFRGAPVPTTPTKVRFSVRPRETRAPRQESTTAATPKTVAKKVAARKR